MAYAYRYTLPENLSKSQYSQLKSLALETARGASVVQTGKFRRGWSSFLNDNVLIVQNSVKYSVYLELGTIYSRQHRFKVRDALNRIGFDTAKPILLSRDTGSTGLTDSQSSNKSIGVSPTNPSLSQIEGANQAGFKDILLPSEDPIDILIKPVPQLNDDIRPTIPIKINTPQEAIQAYRKITGAGTGLTFDEVLSDYKKLIQRPIPVIDLFNEAALTSIIASLILAQQEEDEPNDETNIQSQIP